MSDFFMSVGPALKYLGLDDPDDDSPLAELYRSVLDEGGFDEFFENPCPDYEHDDHDWEKLREKYAKLTESTHPKLQNDNQEPNQIQNEEQNQNKCSMLNKSKDEANADIDVNSLLLQLDSETEIEPKPGISDSPLSLSPTRPKLT